MLSFIAYFGFAGILVSTTIAEAIPAPQPQDLSDVTDLTNDLPVLGGLLGTLSSELTAATATLAPPSAIAEASSRLSSAIEAQATAATYLEVATELVEAGLTADNVLDVIDFVEGALTGENSVNNVNPRDPSPRAYPKASQKDAPYSLSEEALRAAIYIPPTFQYGEQGAPQPVILVPGTGDTGYTTFVGNYIPLLQGSNIADPVWLNIPGYLLGDAQVNAEYVAYAINYIYGISNSRKIAVASWSQGGIDAQWALKYWPSTRNRVTDLVAFSPDYHGTVLADLIDVGEPLPPSVLQQKYNSDFITTLRNNNGDSAYVPTTNVYSGFFDEIVEPQQGRGASAFLKDVRRKGVTNNEVQAVCPDGSPGGSFYTHEGTLYNPLGFALFVDALTHDGPGRPSRLNLDKVCSTYLTDGLDLADFLLTENSILIAGIAILAYPNKVLDEPPIKG